MGPKRRGPVERCWRFILPDEETHCWIWTGDLDSSGYGTIWDIRIAIRAYRAIWTHVFGNVPEGKELHHRCGVKKCVNPFHLEPLTRREHSIKTPQSCCSKHRAKTHCHKGHALSGNNLHIEPGGGRRCITCRREKSRRWTRKHPGEHYQKNRQKELDQKREKYRTDETYRNKRKKRARYDYYRRLNGIPSKRELASASS
jgi:HNH endonuclease